MPRILYFIHVLSLDVALGAACMCFLVFRWLECSPPFPLSLAVYVVLIFSVWLIYAIDHLVDARKMPYPAKTSRHHFHQKYQKTLFFTVLLVTVLAFGIALAFFPFSLWRNGAILCSGMLTYFMFTHVLPLRFPKELWAAIGYTIGISVAPFTLCNFQFSWENILLPLVIILLAFTNLLLFSWYETETDQESEQLSAVILWGEKSVLILLKSLLILVPFLLVVLALEKTTQRKVCVPLMIMWFTFLLLYMKKPCFAKKSYYRLLGDGVFLLPLLLMVL